VWYPFSKSRFRGGIYYSERSFTDMAKYVCTVCGFVYDEAEGYPDAGIAAGTKWEDLPDDFTCPICGVGKDMFEQE